MTAAVSVSKNITGIECFFNNRKKKVSSHADACTHNHTARAALAHWLALLHSNSGHPLTGFSLFDKATNRSVTAAHCGTQGEAFDTLRDGDTNTDALMEELGVKNTQRCTHLQRVMPLLVCPEEMKSKQKSHGNGRGDSTYRGRPPSTKVAAVGQRVGFSCIL